MSLFAELLVPQNHTIEYVKLSKCQRKNVKIQKCKKELCPKKIGSSHWSLNSEKVLVL